MKKRLWVVSLGGSLIIPDSIDVQFLEQFKRTLEKHYANSKFVIVCGGGAIARRYIAALKQENRPQKELSLAGIRATRMNALFLMQFFGKSANTSLPLNMTEVKNMTEKHNVVICGALRLSKHSTSDTTAAKLAYELKSSFVNMTNVRGLYSADPKKHKNAGFIRSISWKDFEKKALSLKYESGQHFVLDQNASIVIRKHHIPAYILGKDLNNLSKLLARKKFIGTTIAG